jgi:short-subunit dehydrogenase
LSWDIRRIAILGASRGLGRAFVKVLCDSHKGCDQTLELFISSRKAELLQSLKQEVEAGSPHRVEFEALDFAQSSGQEAALQRVKEFCPQTLCYFAGGGPFGAFGSKKWRDHEWAYQVSLLFPARLVYSALQTQGSDRWIKQMVVVGSAIAEERADPFAGSYASAKHALLGLYRSVSAEEPELDFRLYSPGYMNTDLLPQNAWPRQQNMPILSPEEVARDLWEWLPSDDIRGYRRFTPEPLNNDFQLKR